MDNPNDKSPSKKTDKKLGKAMKPNKQQPQEDYAKKLQELKERQPNLNEMAKDDNGLMKPVEASEMTIKKAKRALTCKNCGFKLMGLGKKPPLMDEQRLKQMLMEESIKEQPEKETKFTDKQIDSVLELCQRFVKQLKMKPKDEKKPAELIESMRFVRQSDGSYDLHIDQEKFSPELKALGVREIVLDDGPLIILTGADGKVCYNPEDTVTINIEDSKIYLLDPGESVSCYLENGKENESKTKEIGVQVGKSVLNEKKEPDLEPMEVNKSNNKDKEDKAELINESKSTKNSKELEEPEFMTKEIGLQVENSNIDKKETIKQNEELLDNKRRRIEPNYNESKSSDENNKTDIEPMDESKSTNNAEDAAPEPMDESKFTEEAKKPNPEPMDECKPSDEAKKANPELMDESNPEPMDESKPTDEAKKANPEPIE